MPVASLRPLPSTSPHRANLHRLQDNGYAIPAVNCVTSSSINACLEAARQNDAPIIIQVRPLATTTD